MSEPDAAATASGADQPIDEMSFDTAKTEFQRVVSELELPHDATG